jgi:hypothetical protein
LRERPPVNGQDDLRKNPRVIILPRVSLLKNNKILFTIFKINKNKNYIIIFCFVYYMALGVAGPPSRATVWPWGGSGHPTNINPHSLSVSLSEEPRKW